MFVELYNSETSKWVLINISKIDIIEPYFDENEENKFYREGVILHSKTIFVDATIFVDRPEKAPIVFHGMNYDMLKSAITKAKLNLLFQNIIL